MYELRVLWGKYSERFKLKNKKLVEKQAGAVTYSLDRLEHLYESLSKKIQQTGSFETKNGAVRNVGRSGCSKCVESRVLAWHIL